MTGGPSKLVIDMKELPEAQSEENSIVQTAKMELKTHKARIEDLELSIEDLKREKELLTASLLEGKEKVVQELETAKKREIEKRDKIIIAGNCGRAINERAIDLFLLCPIFVLVFVDQVEMNTQKLFMRWRGK